MKRIISIGLSTLLMVICVPAFAATSPTDSSFEKENTATNSIILVENFLVKSDGANQTVEPRIYWNSNINLTAGTWMNVTGSFNVIPDNPIVISDANNPGPVTFRTIDANGRVLTSNVTVAPGTRVSLGSIPIGSYTIQANAYVSGLYKFTID